MAGAVETDLLARIVAGRLHVCHHTLVVSYYHIGRRTWYPKKPDAHPVSGRLRFRFGPARATVYRNRLVWMFFNRATVPAGCVVDHVDGDCTNDHPSNLAVMTHADSHAQGNARQSDRVLDRLLGFFEHVGWAGTPPDDHPIWGDQ